MPNRRDRSSIQPARTWQWSVQCGAGHHSEAQYRAEDGDCEEVEGDPEEVDHGGPVAVRDVQAAQHGTWQYCSEYDVYLRRVPIAGKYNPRLSSIIRKATKQTGSKHSDLIS